MSHDLSIKNGKAEMFSGSGQVPWHGLGTVVEGLLTSAEAIKAAGLDWEVVEEQVFKKNGDYKQCEGYKAIVRQDTGELLAIMGDTYQIIQNRDAFEFFDSVVQTKEAVYDTAGALRGGRRVWIMAKLPGKLFVNGDEHEKYVLLTTSHDGAYSLTMMIVLVRVVCQNTLSIAVKGGKNVIKIRHTENYMDKVSEARRVLGIADKYFQNLAEALNALGTKLLTPTQMAEFTKALCPAKNEEKVSPQTQTIRDEVNRLFTEGQGNQGKTRWDALQAVTDYVDHSAKMRDKTGSNRIENSLMNNGAKLKQEAYDLLTNEELMASLLNKPITPVSRTTDNDFARLMQK